MTRGGVEWVRDGVMAGRSNEIDREVTGNGAMGIAAALRQHYISVKRCYIGVPAKLRGRQEDISGSTGPAVRTSPAAARPV